MKKTKKRMARRTAKRITKGVKSLVSGVKGAVGAIKSGLKSQVKKAPPGKTYLRGRLIDMPKKKSKPGDLYNKKMGKC